MKFQFDDGIFEGRGVIEGSWDKDGETDGKRVADGRSERDGTCVGRKVIVGASEMDGASDSEGIWLKLGVFEGAFEDGVAVVGLFVGVEVIKSHLYPSSPSFLGGASSVQK